MINNFQYKTMESKVFVLLCISKLFLSPFNDSELISSEKQMFS